MSDRIDVQLDTLFLSEVNKRNTDKNGKEIDKGLTARMQHPICVECHEKYKQKYPDQPFIIKCKGIFVEKDFIEKQEQLKARFPDEEPLSLDEIRETYDVPFWAERNIIVKDDDGNLVPFVARWYQRETLLCTARNKVDRWGRGLGKTVCGVIEELHKAMTTKNLDILIVSPADAQSEKWYTEIAFQIDHSPSLQGIEAQRKQQPFKFFRFTNGSTIAIFTAGSASGRGANSLRGQDPRRVRLDEQDYLAEDDYKAIDPLIVRHKNSEFHGSSTPTGDRGKFWQMCTKFPNYREFHFPITVLPDWSNELEDEYRRQAKTDDIFRHEYLAEFSDPTSGVFKSQHIDAASKIYTNPTMPSLRGYDTCRYDAACRYFMGVDWNGAGTGTRIRVVGFNPTTHIRKCVAARTIDTPGYTTSDSIQAIVEMNKIWHCEEIYVDAGFGFAQDELIRMTGAKSTDRDTQRLKDIHVVDFGADLMFNRLVSKRDDNPNSKYLPDPKLQELKRRTKPFMVEGAVMAFEHRLVEFSDLDTVLDEQLRAYRVKNYSAHGHANTYETDGGVGDHDLDAFMMALLGVEQKYGIFATKETFRRLAQMTFVSGWGMPTAPVATTPNQAMSPTEKRLERAGIPSRQSPSDPNREYRLVYLMKQGMGTTPGGMIAPVKRGGMGGAPDIPSRTSAFKKGPKGRSRF